LDEKRTYALITGGSSGIGLALAHEFASRGHDIALVSLANTGQENAITDLTKLYNVNVKSLEINLLDKDAIHNVVRWVKVENMTIQALVNNAGMGYAGKFEDLNEGFISTLLDLNIKVTTLLTHALIPELKQHTKSYILNLSSAAAFYSMPYKSIYAGSKRFVLDFSMALNEELKSHNIGVTAVCPINSRASSQSSSECYVKEKKLRHSRSSG